MNDFNGTSIGHSLMPGCPAARAEDESELDFYKGSLEDLGKIRDEEVPIQWQHFF